MITSEQIRGARAMLGMTQSTLAQKAGISTTGLNNIERGSADPKASTLKAIQSALEAAGIIFVAENGEGPGARLRKLRVGDQVLLRAGSPEWGRRQDLKDKIGRVTAVVSDGTSMHRVTVTFEGKEEFVGMDAGRFQLAGVALAP